MEELNIPMAAILAHVLMSCIPWVLGIAIGGGLGALCPLGMRAILSARPAWRRTLVLLPWRTCVMGLLMAACSPLIVTLLGIRPFTGGIMVGVAVGLLAMAFTATILAENWHPSPLVAQLVGGARTLAVASSLIAAGVGLLGGGGVGHVILNATRLMEYGPMWQGLLVILALALVLDLGLAIAQMVFLNPPEASDQSDTAISP